MSIADTIQRRFLIGAAAFSLLGMGAAGTLLVTQAASAQTAETPTPTGTSPDATPVQGSNEDPAHEAAESPEQEAAEDSGQWHGHGGGTHDCDKDQADGATDDGSETGSGAVPAQ